MVEDFSEVKVHDESTGIEISERELSEKEISETESCEPFVPGGFSVMRMVRFESSVLVNEVSAGVVVHWSEPF
jgi:hypothetical protein